MQRLLATLLAALTLSAPLAAQAPRTDLYTPARNNLCAAGEAAGQGCAAIRDRRIVDASAAPWRMIGRVNFAGVEMRSHCSGTMVAERVVLTAAHCLYNEARARWIAPQALRFAAGYQRGTSVAVSPVARYVLAPGLNAQSRDWRNEPAQDWALLVLEIPIGRETGVAALDPAPGPLSLAGYAGLRPHVLSIAEDCGAATGKSADVLVTGCSAMMGDSGGPLFVRKDDTLHLAGLLSAVAPNASGLRSIAVPTTTIAETLTTMTGD